MMMKMEVLLHDFGRICSLSLSLSPLSSRSPNFFSFVQFDFECFLFFLSSKFYRYALCSLALKLAAFLLTPSPKSLSNFDLISFICMLFLFTTVSFFLLLSLSLYLIHATNFQN